MKDSTAIGLGCVFVIGLAVAFLAGVTVARRTVTEHETSPHANAGNAALPNLFSPNPTHDPYFIDQERRNLEALERTCRQTGKYCHEAAQMRQSLAGSGAVP
jgi:hypothetical protein